MAGLRKKKLDEEIEIYFPGLTNQSTIREYYSRLKKRTELELQAIRGKDNLKEIETIDRYFLSQIKPKVYGGSQGLEVQHKNAFEDTCFVLQQYNVIDPKSLTVFEFYRALEKVKEQVKRQEKKNGKRA